MLKIAIEDQRINKVDNNGEIIEKVKINERELQGTGWIIPTYELMKGFEKEFPEIDFYFVGGSDLFPTLHLWQYGA